MAISQGTLNLVRASVIVPSYSNLSITPEYMNKEMAHLDFVSDATNQYETGTGLVNSPQPYVKATLSVAILKTQSLAAAWFAQFQLQTILGTISVHPDVDSSVAWPVIRMHTCALMKPQPGKFNGTDAGLVLTISGLINANSALFSF